MYRVMAAATHVSVIAVCVYIISRVIVLMANSSRNRQRFNGVNQLMAMT